MLKILLNTEFFILNTNLFNALFMIQKKWILTILIFLVTLNVVNSQESLKIISYNIWNGFEWGKDSVRKEKLINWVNDRSPDVVALQELCAYTNEKLSTDAQTWGHDYSVLLKSSGYSVGLTSKYPIVIKERILNEMHHGALHCQTNGLEIFVVHLSPFQWEKRNTEAEILIERIETEIGNGNNVIVCGDFNALSPVDADWYKNNIELLKSRLEGDEKHAHVKNMREGTFCYSAMSKFFGAGLYDVSANFINTGIERISCPTQVFAKNKEDKERLIKMGTRIDYILTSYNLVEKCTGAKILNGEESFLLSDHYPVEAEFKLNKHD